MRTERHEQLTFTEFLEAVRGLVALLPHCAHSLLPQLCRVADWRDQDFSIPLYQKLPLVLTAIVNHKAVDMEERGTTPDQSLEEDNVVESATSSCTSSDGSDFTTDDGSDTGDSNFDLSTDDEGDGENAPVVLVDEGMDVMNAE